MAEPNRKLLDLAAAAAASDGFGLIQAPKISPSAIDPLGLRSTNFEHMARVAEGLNNVARHVRPFSFVAWAWHRALTLTSLLGLDTSGPELRAFVARCEVIFLWSLMLADKDVDLPGKQPIAKSIGMAPGTAYTFSGPAWNAFRDNREGSTALQAAANYGPGLRALGWLMRNASDPQGNAMVPAPSARPAILAFEALIADRLVHPAFNDFGPVTVTMEEALAWAPAWALGNLTVEEQAHAARNINGHDAHPDRRSGLSLLIAAANRRGAPSFAALPDEAVADVRNALAGEASDFAPPPESQEVSERWRRLQVRQLFRHSLEAFLAWTIDAITERPRDTAALVAAFIKQADLDPSAPASEWLATAAADDPVSKAVAAINTALKEKGRQSLPAAIARGLAISLAAAQSDPEPFDREDRLPVSRAKSQAISRADEPLRGLIRHAIETWVLAQHVYWAVGRGLQDARQGARSILRLKVVMEEGGWTVIPGTRPMSPAPTGDRVRTAMTLSYESGLMFNPAA